MSQQKFPDLNGEALGKCEYESLTCLSLVEVLKRPLSNIPLWSQLVELFESGCHRHLMQNNLNVPGFLTVQLTVE